MTAPSPTPTPSQHPDAFTGTDLPGWLWVLFGVFAAVAVGGYAFSLAKVALGRDEQADDQTPGEDQP